MLRNMKRRRPKRSAGITGEKITDITCTTARVFWSTWSQQPQEDTAEGVVRMPSSTSNHCNEAQQQHRKGNHSALVAPWP